MNTDKRVGFKTVMTGLGLALALAAVLTLNPLAQVNANDNTPATGAPTISGDARVGQTLTADTFDISDADGLGNVSYSYQWIRNDSGTDTDIDGATASTYTLVDADEGKTIKVRVSFSDYANNPETLTSEATAEVVSAATVWAATMTVGVSGDYAGYSAPVQLGELSSRAFVIDGVGYRVQVLLHDADLLYLRVNRSIRVNLAFYVGTEEFALADASAHTVQGTALYQWDKGSLIVSADGSVKVALVRPDGSELPVPNSLAAGMPTISGTVKVGQTLTADTKDIEDADGLDNPDYSYQWIRSDSGMDTDIDGATASTYTLVKADEGKTIKVRVTFSDNESNQETLTSEATSVVVPNSPATGTPTISGIVQVGRTLTADTKDIEDADGLNNVSYSYQWIRRDSGTDADIDGATVSTYTLVEADKGKTIKVRVTFTDDTNSEETLISEATSAVKGQDEDATPPRLVRPRVDGTTLSVAYSEALDEDSTPLAEAFLVGVTCRCDDTRWWDAEARRTLVGISVEGAAVILTLASAVEQGNYVVFRYTPPADTAAARILDRSGNAAEWSDDVQVFNDTGKDYNNAATGSPTIDGKAQVGKTLTANTRGISDRDGVTNVIYSYRWLADDTVIDGERSSTYTLQPSDNGKVIKVRVTFTDNADFYESLTSAGMMGGL